MVLKQIIDGYLNPASTSQASKRSPATHPFPSRSNNPNAARTCKQRKRQGHVCGILNHTMVQFPLAFMSYRIYIYRSVIVPGFVLGRRYWLFLLHVSTINISLGISSGTSKTWPITYTQHSSRLQKQPAISHAILQNSYIYSTS